VTYGSNDLNGAEYQVSNDNGATWKYWTGAAWGAAASATDRNDLTTLRTHITTLAAGALKLRIYLVGDTLQSEIDQINVTYNNNAPSTPSSLGPAGLVNGSGSANNTPTLNFTLSDLNTYDTVGYRIQIDNTSNFSSPEVDYTSALGAQGATSFTVGQAAGGGSYTAGSGGQTLADGNYYWRVLAKDAAANASANATANAGAVAFNVDTVVRQIQFSASTSSAAESTAAPNLVVSIASATFQDVTADYTVTSGSASGGGTDYTLASGTVTITAGSSTANITPAIVADVLDEPDETIQVTLSNPTHGTLGATSVHTFTITDDDATPTLAVGDVTVNENAGTATITVTMTSQSQSSVTVDHATSNGTATAGTDYTATSGTLTWTTGQTGAKTYTVPISEDVLDEADETINVTLSNVSASATLADATGVVTITDNDASPSIAFTSASSSASEATTAVSLGLTLSAVSGRDVTVDYSVTGGTATGGGTDFTLASGTATITAGSTTTNIAMTVVDDPTVEANETVIVTAANPTNASLGVNTAHTYTINNNDTASATIVESGGSVMITEGSTTDTYTVVLNSQPSADVVITPTPNGQVTVNPVALTFTNGNWNIAQTITVTAVDDAIAEGAHVGSITHAATSADVLFNGMTVATVVPAITDNDSAAMSFAESGGSTDVAENAGTDTYTVVLTSQPTADVVVNLTHDAQTTVAPSSLTFTTGNWNLPQTVTVTGAQDHIAEGNHTGVIHHTATGADATYAALAVSNITAHLTDDDAAGVLITESASSTAVTEAGATDTYTVQLISQPTTNVTIAASYDAAQLTLSPASLVFTNANWNVPQTVTVGAADDSLVDVVPNSTITHRVSASTDLSYPANMSITSVIVAITDNDTADSGGTNTAPSVYPATPLVVVEGGTGKLFAAASDPDDGNILSYAWNQVSGPSVSIAAATTSNATFVAPAYLEGRSTLVFRVTVSDGIASTTADVTVTVAKNGRTISTFGGVEIDKKISAVSESGDTVRETDTNGELTYTLGTGAVVEGLSDKSHVLFSNGKIVIADPNYDQSRGIVAVLDSTELPIGQLMISDTAFLTLPGVNAVVGSHIGDRYGYALSNGDFDGDGYDELFVTAAGTTNGTLYVLDFDTLEVVNLMLGSEEEALKSPLMVAANVNGLVADDAVMGITSSVNTSLALTSSSETTNAFNGMLASTNFPTVVNFATVTPDFEFDTTMNASQLNRGDLNGDSFNDLVISSGDSCESIVVFGSAEIGASQTQLDGSHTIGCHDTTSFTSAAVADVNGDGYADIIFGYPDADGGNGMVAVHFGSSMWTDSDYATGNALLIYGEAAKSIGTWLLTGDSDGDGVADIYTNLGHDGDSTVIRLAITPTPTTSGNAIFGGGGCSLVAREENTKSNTIPFWIVLMIFPVMGFRLRRKFGF
jgi:hypothetical protein